MTNKTYAAATAGVVVLLGSMVAAVPAQAQGANFTRDGGRCSPAASWVLKAKPDSGRLQLEFSVETQRSGQAWWVRVTDNGSRVFAGRRVTGRISHSLTVRQMVKNRAGTDRLVARATNPKTGVVCRGHVAIRPVR